MRLTPLIILLLVLISPCTVFAATNENLSIINPLNSINNLSSVNVSSNITANHTDSISSVNAVQTQSSTESSENVGEEMIINAFSRLIVNFANMFLNGLGGVRTGQLNDTNVSGEKVAIFAVVAHTIDPTTDPATMQDVANIKQVYVYFVILFALLLALFLIFQQIQPHRAAQIVETVTGQYGFVGIDEMIEYYAVTCGWLLFGPAQFYAALWLNNYLVQSLMLSVLDFVTFKSDNVMLYATMVTLWVILVSFFALRLVTIIIIVRLWYLLGILLAVKRIRWLGLLAIAYMNGVIFYQFFLVWPAVTVVSYVNTHAMSGFSEAFVYLGLFLLELIITLIVLFWPLLFAVISPKTWKTLLMVARYSA